MDENICTSRKLHVHAYCCRCISPRLATLIHTAAVSVTALAGDISLRGHLDSMQRARPVIIFDTIEM